MAAVALPRTGLKFVMTVRDGPDVGATFQLLPPRVTIGRGGDNHVPLSDPRVSRQAAVIEFSLERITITDLSGRESMMVNGYSAQASPLQAGDLVRIGETELRFVVEAIELSPISPASTSSPRPSAGAGVTMGPRSNGMDAERKAKIRFYALVGAGLLIFIYLMNSSDGKRVKEKGIPTVQQIEETIKVANENRILVEKRNFKTDEERTRAEESKRHFVLGFRDYQRQQWSRAIRSFETAQAIDPKNESAGRYRRLAEKQRDELINSLTLEGRRYREKSMYGRCSAAFEKVIDLLPNKQDVKFKTAEALKAECDAMMRERF